MIEAAVMSGKIVHVSFFPIVQDCIGESRFTLLPQISDSNKPGAT